MKEFPNLTELGMHLAEVAIGEAVFLNRGLEAAAALIEKEAKREFGVYQPATGPFPEWAELAESTQERREAAGYTPNDPLLVTGDLRDTISHETHGLDAVVGSTSDIMFFHEFGTSRMPARPVLGPAAFRHRREVEELIAKAAVIGIVGAREFGIASLQSGGQLPVHESLGYDFNAGESAGNGDE